MKKKRKYKTQLKGYCPCGWRFPHIEVLTLSYEPIPLERRYLLICPECGACWEQSGEGVTHEVVRPS
jgi:hypothetical protein